jgi:hypothetical protein
MSSVPIPFPPGGLLTCESGQMPVVNIQGGTSQIICSCATPPTSLNNYNNNFRALQNWVLEVVTRQSRRFEQRITDEEASILALGVYHGITEFGQRYTCYFVMPERGTLGGASLRAT